MGTSLHFLPGTCRVLALLQAVRLITPTRSPHLGRGSFQQVPKEKQEGGQGASEATPNRGLTRQARLMAGPPHTGAMIRAIPILGGTITSPTEKWAERRDKTLTPCRTSALGGELMPAPTFPSWEAGRAEPPQSPCSLAK